MKTRWVWLNIGAVIATIFWMWVFEDELQEEAKEKVANNA